MKSKRRWFAGFALVLPVVILLAVLVSLQPASAATDIDVNHAYYGAIFDEAGNPVPPPDNPVEVKAEDAGGVIRVGPEYQNPIYTTQTHQTPAGETLVYGFYYDASAENLLIGGDPTEINDNTPTPIYVNGKIATEYRECEAPGDDEGAGPWTPISELTWGVGKSTGTCIDLRAPMEEVPTHTLRVQSAGCCTVTVDGGIVAPGAGPIPFDFLEGTTVNLTATTGTCCIFAEWTVDGTPVAGNPISVTVDADHVVVATCNPRGNLDLTVNQVGTGTVTIDSQTVTPPEEVFPIPCGDTVTATATGEGFWYFDHWSGNVDPVLSKTSPITIYMDDPKEITATFVEGPHEYSLVVTSTGCYTIEVYTDTTLVGTVGPGASEPFVIPAMVDVTVEAVKADAVTCCSLEEWLLDDVSQGDPVSITFNMDKEYAVELVAALPPFYLMLNPDPAAGGTVTATPWLAQYACEVVTLTATANVTDHWEFAGWIGDLISDNPIETITMNKDKVVTGTFERETFSVTITITPTEGGEVTVTQETEDGKYEYGETITVTAYPSPCYEFVGWGGDWAGITDTQVITTVTGELNIFATFQPVQPHTLYAYADPSEGGSVDPISITYECCTYATVTATAEDGYTFTGWLGDIGGEVSTTNPISIHMLDKDLVITATFEESGAPPEKCFTLTPAEAITTTPLAMHVFTLELTNVSCGAGTTFVLTNTDSMWDAGNSWVALSTDGVTLDDGVSADVVVTMTIPAAAGNWVTGTTVVTATAGDTVVTSTLQLWTGGVEDPGAPAGWSGCRYDINLNGEIDGQDIGAVSSKFPLDYPFYDYNLNGEIDGQDIGAVSSKFPNECQPPQ